MLLLKRRGMSIYRHEFEFLMRFRPSGATSSHLGHTSTRRVEDEYGGILDRHISIWVKSGLPSIQFDATAIHELTHAWLQLAGVKCVSLQVEEGVAELNSYWLLSSMSDPVAAVLMQRMMNNPDPVYGDGFRAFWSAEQRFGWEAVAKHLCGTGRLLN